MPERRVENVSPNSKTTLQIPEKPSREFLHGLIAKSRKIADIGFGQGDWIHYARKINPKAIVHGVEAKTEEDEFSGRQVAQKQLKIPGSHLSYKGFEHWLTKPEQYDLVNAGLFLMNHRESVLDRIYKKLGMQIALGKNRVHEKKYEEYSKKRDEIMRQNKSHSSQSSLELYLGGVCPKLAEEEVGKHLRSLREKKLARKGVLRLVEWMIAREHVLKMLQTAGFKKIIYRTIPKSEVISACEQNAAEGDDYLVMTGHGAPVEILAFK